MSQTSNSSEYPGDWRARRCGGRWRPLEIVAVVLGFVLFWPIGLAILALKFWQTRCGHRGDLATFAQEKTDWARDACRNWRPGAWASRSPAWSTSQGGSPRPGGSWNMRSTGNAAFDDWRAAELARLEEERRKLEDAEREFTEHIDELRRARDREEFERFMNARRGRGGQPPANP